MIKNNRAQIMSIDILFSVVLVILMFFLLFNIVEARTYQTNTDSINQEFEMIGNLAFTRLINNPNINCYAKDSSNSFNIPSCLAINNSELTKENLGIPSNYKCLITPTTSTFNINECTDVLNMASTSHFYEIDFNVSIVTNRSILKRNYVQSYLGLNPSMNTIEQINLKVWQ